MVYKSGQISHKTSIYRALGWAEIVESQIYTHYFTQKINTWLNKLSSINLNKLIFCYILACKKTKSCTRYRRFPYLCLFETT